MSCKQSLSLRNEDRNSLLMTCHYPDLGSASDWLCSEENLLQPIRSINQIWIVTWRLISKEFLWYFPGRHFTGRVTRVTSVAKCRLFTQWLRCITSHLYFCWISNYSRKVISFGLQLSGKEECLKLINMRWIILLFFSSQRKGRSRLFVSCYGRKVRTAFQP